MVATTIFRQAMEDTPFTDQTIAPLVAPFEEAMRAAQITTPRRAAAFYSQLGHESGGMRYVAEIQTNGPNWTDDRRIYRGRGYIQLTWMGNYRKFGQWCQSKGFVDDPEIFVKNPTLVEQPRWAFLSASWYWLYGGPRPGRINEYADAGDIMAVSRCVNGWVEGQEPNGYRDRVKRWNQALAFGPELLPGTGSGTNAGGNVTVTNRPDFNELNQIDGTHCSPRSRPPINIFLHTQEGDGNAEDLAAFCRRSSGDKAVSYHNAIAEDRNDHGVTVVNIVDTDYYSWSVLDANVFSINHCFAGSRAAQTREQWLAWYRNAIRVAAYLCVEDCKKYTTLSSNVILPPYQSGAGISDHRYVSLCLKIGNHTDVGGPTNPPWSGFPWDVFVADIHSFNGVPPNAPPIAVEPTENQMLKRIYDDTHYAAQQLGPGDPSWKSVPLTLRDMTYAIGDRAGVVLPGKE